MYAFHDSQNLRYRAPFGAAAVGTKVKLCLEVYHPAPGTSCFVRVWTGEQAALIPMECSRWGDPALFSAEVTMPEEGCVLWYSFVMQNLEGERLYYGNNDACLGGRGRMYESSPKSYQITVYRPNPTPDWYKNGIAYQIFPDRFFRGQDWAERQQAALRPAGWKGPRRILQQDWDDVPFYCRNERGEITRWAFFGGTLEGIREKLGYLKSLGVTILYLNPIFEAASNHRYDTADYLRVDPALGDEESFRRLAAEAREQGIRIVLDGVFNHTGADSRYFDRLGNYGGDGACRGEDSPYYKWFRFREFPDSYACWWGVKDLPDVEEMEPTYQAFIYGDRDSVIRHWLRQGASGWRLDVADELPDAFIQGIRHAMDETATDSVLLGEVWEDASNKESYGQLRAYFQGEELHSTMNYPFRTAAIDFMLGRSEAGEFCARMMSLKENYPPENFYGALNLIGSHDRERILTVLGEAPESDTMDELERECYRLPAGQYELARRRLALLSLIQFTMPGVPCIYYGDEAGCQGYSDPFNRGTYPWGREDETLLAHYRALTALRQAHPVLSAGEYLPLSHGGNVYECLRTGEGETIQVLVNRSPDCWERLELLPEDASPREIFHLGARFREENGVPMVELPPLTGTVLLRKI